MNQTGWEEEEEEVEDRGSNYLGDKEQRRERTGDYNKIWGFCFSAKCDGFKLLPVFTTYLGFGELLLGGGNQLGIWQPKGKSLQMRSIQGLSNVSRIWFVSILQFYYDVGFILRLNGPSSPSESKMNAAAPLHMLSGSVPIGKEDLLVSKKKKLFVLFCFTLCGSQAYSHAHSWTKWWARAWVTSFNLVLVYMLCCDG